jgi:hypothetical protein
MILWRPPPLGFVPDPGDCDAGTALVSTMLSIMMCGKMNMELEDFNDVDRSRGGKRSAEP